MSLAAIAALSTTLFAGDVRISGFVNVVGGVNDVDAAAYVGGPANLGNPDYNGNKQSQSYMGYDDQYDFANDSLAAIQFSAGIADNMGATIQLIAQNNAAGDDIRWSGGMSILMRPMSYGS